MTLISLDQVLNGDACALPLGDSSVDCVITSPPYGVGIEYDGYTDVDPMSREYQRLIHGSTREMFRVLKPGGRVWVNIMPSVPLPGSAERAPLGMMWCQALLASGLQYRDTVTWIQDSFDGSCGWGSWKKPTAPNLRGSYEIILSFYKQPYKREVPLGQEGYKDGFEGTEWQDLVRNVWKINPARRRPGAPAPYPEELVERCVRLSTFPLDVVLDPFAGSGTTIKVANRMGRTGIGYDIGAST